MCGFIASFGQNMSHNDFYDAMDHLKRRGPDAEGVWNEKDVFFGSTRLAIFGAPRATPPAQRAAPTQSGAQSTKINNKTYEPLSSF